MIINDSLYGNFRTRKFTDIYPDFATFDSNYRTSGIPDKISGANLQTLYYLLYARYGNSHIASADENQFKYGVMSTIFMYGPAWEKRLEVQDRLRSLDESELLSGAKAVYNTAMNPSQLVPEEEIVDYINQQNTTRHTKGILEGYSVLIELLETDVTASFIDKFKKLFITVVEPDYPLWYKE